MAGGILGGLVPSLSKTINKVASDIVSVRTGTVTSDSVEPKDTLVILDNDPFRSQVVGQSVAGPIPAGTRVSCLAYPPRGLLILGALTDIGGGGPPIGSIMLWANATPPDGWLICNGQSTAAYPDLAALVGGTVPDMRDRTAVGASGTKALLSQAGAATVTLSIANLAAHGHSITGASQSHAVVHSHNMSSLLKTPNASGAPASDNGGDSVAQGTTNARFSGGQSGSTANGSSPHTHDPGTYAATNTGSGTPFSVLNPYTALHYIIRAE